MPEAVTTPVICPVCWTPDGLTLGLDEASIRSRLTQDSFPEAVYLCIANLRQQPPALIQHSQRIVPRRQRQETIAPIGLSACFTLAEAVRPAGLNAQTRARRALFIDYLPEYAEAGGWRVSRALRSQGLGINPGLRCALSGNDSASA